MLTKTRKALLAALVALTVPLTACENPLSTQSAPETTVITITQEAEEAPTNEQPSSAEPAKKQNAPVSHEVSDDIKQKMLTQTWPGLCGMATGPMVNGEFNKPGDRAGYGSIVFKEPNGELKVKMLQFDFDKDGTQEMYVVASCVPGATGWPPLLVKVNSDLTLDPGPNKRGIGFPDGVTPGRGGFKEFRAEGDTLHLSFPASAPGDPGCCPSLTETGNYEVKNNKLVKVNSDSTSAQSQTDVQQRCQSPILPLIDGHTVTYCDGTWAKTGKYATDWVEYFYWSDGAWRHPEWQGTLLPSSSKCYSAEYLKTLPPRPSAISLDECKPQDVGKF